MRTGIEGVLQDITLELKPLSELSGEQTLHIVI